MIEPKHVSVTLIDSVIDRYVIMHVRSQRARWYFLPRHIEPTNKVRSGGLTLRIKRNLMIVKVNSYKVERQNPLFTRIK